MRVLVACEFSGVVRDAFRARGHNAWSCDLLPSEGKHTNYHAQMDVRKFIPQDFDLMIAHPPCTFLAVSGARWFKDRIPEQVAALDFVKTLMETKIHRICIENPISVISSKIRKPDQIIQPHQFGHPQFKATCLWLKNLPPLRPTQNLLPPEKGTEEHKQWSKVHRMAPGPDRWKERSRTFTGIAEAMADQWGNL